jgi:predicted homoserine dehydrogenase-like protein
MFLSQAARTRGMHVAAVADLRIARARDALARLGWAKESYGAHSIENAIDTRTSCVLDDAESLIKYEGIDVVVEATGNPAAGVRHALLCCKHRKHIVMVNVEADALAGPLLARCAERAGIIYSLAYGDQPALIVELVDWARTAGFDVVAAGKGTKYLSAYHQSTPETVWGHYGFTADQVSAGDFNPRMFNSFLDGTKSALEMAVVSNATGLDVPEEGLNFPPCGTDDLPHILRPREDGGMLARKGMVEVVSCLERDGRPVFKDLRWGVYVIIEAADEYARKCFDEYGLRTDSSGRYAAMYKPFHLIGLELGLSVASVTLRSEPTGATRGFNADVVATAKQNLSTGQRLDGEGGYTVYGTLVPSARSLTIGGLPIGLAHEVTLRRPVKAGSLLTWNDVSIDETIEVVQFRRSMEKEFRSGVIQRQE